MPGGEEGHWTQLCLGRRVKHNLPLTHSAQSRTVAGAMVHNHVQYVHVARPTKLRCQTHNFQHTGPLATKAARFLYMHQLMKHSHTFTGSTAQQHTLWGSKFWGRRVAVDVGWQLQLDSTVDIVLIKSHVQT